MRILVVDDDRPVARSLQRLLERHGFEVALAQDGAEAIARAEASPPDLVLCDFRMPGMSGVEVLLEMRKRSPRTVRFMISGLSDVTTSSAYAEAQVHQFVPKPWDDSQLITLIRSALADREDR